MSCWTCMLVTLTPWWFGPTLRHGIESSNGMHMYYNHRYIYYAAMHMCHWVAGVLGWRTGKLRLATNGCSCLWTIWTCQGRGQLRSSMMDHLGIIRELKHDESVLCLNTCWAYIILAWNKSFRKDLFGSQPPLELLRQWIDYGCWYDRLKQTLRPCSRRHSSTTAPDSAFFAVSSF